MQTIHHPALAAQDMPAQAAFDYDHLIKALIELNIARKNVLFYPERHIQVQKSIDLAHACLIRSIETADEIALVVAKESLSVDGCLLDPSNSVLQELKAVFRSRNIAVLTFRKGLSRDDLAGFLLRLASAEETAVPLPTGAAPHRQEPASDTIRIQAVDYSKFSHTEEAVINRKRAHGGKAPPDSVWNDFVHGLAAGILLDPDDTTPGEAFRRPTPTTIAGHLNRLEQVETELLKKYEDVIKEHLQDASWGSEKHPDSGWAALCRCFEQLKPGLRNQFLSVTYDQCALQKNPESLDPLFQRLPLKLLTEMLQTASRGERDISPSLLNFVAKVLNARSIGGPSPEREAARRLAGEIGALAAPEMAATLFRKENFGAYVTPDYEASLNRLLRPQVSDAATGDDRLNVREHLKTLEDGHLSEHIAAVGVALLTGRLDADLYQEVAEQLTRLANELAQRVHIGLLSKMLQVFLDHSRTKPPDPRSAAARAALDQLCSPMLVRTLRAALEASGRWADPEATAFLFTLGPNAVPEALHLYLQRDAPQREEWLSVLIGRYPQHLFKEVIKRLQLYAGAHTVELLKIFEKLVDPACTTIVRSFLMHPDEAVQHQALKVLLRFDDAEGVARLRTLLDSKKSQDFMAGLTLAETYAVAGVAEDLARRLKTRFLCYRSDFVRNEKILLALQRFGYRLPASDLERLNRIRFALYPKHLARMKSLVAAMLPKRPALPKPDRIRRSIPDHDADAQ